MAQLEGIKVEDPQTPVAGAPPVALPRAASSFKPAEPKRGGLVQLQPLRETGSSIFKQGK